MISSLCSFLLLQARITILHSFPQFQSIELIQTWSDNGVVNQKLYYPLFWFYLKVELKYPTYKKKPVNHPYLSTKQYRKRFFQWSQAAGSSRQRPRPYYDLLKKIHRKFVIYRSIHFYYFPPRFWWSHNSQWHLTISFSEDMHGSFDEPFWSVDYFQV